MVKLNKISKGNRKYGIMKSVMKSKHTSRNLKRNLPGSKQINSNMPSTLVGYAFYEKIL